MTGIAAIVLNYRTPGLVVDCLETLVDEVDPEVDAIVVVDNASGDGSPETIRRAVDANDWKHVRVVELEDNRGFSAGLNAGIAAVRADVYLLLNSDILVRPGAVDTLRHALAEDASLGLVGPRLEWPDGRPQMSGFRLHSPWSELISASQTGLIRRGLEGYDVAVPIREERSVVGWASFAAILVRREVMEQVGPLDEGYFMYFEDVDYCRRAGGQGWRIAVEPAAHIVHLRGATSPVKSLQAEGRRKPAYYYVSRSRYFRKSFGTAGLLAANLLWTLGAGIAALRRELDRRDQPRRESQLRDIWRDLVSR